MRSFKIKIAEKVFLINSLFDEVYYLCRDFLTDEKEDFILTVSEKNISDEKEKPSDNDGVFPDSYFETLAVYRKIAEILIDYDIILFHGSALSMDREGYIFAAPSGTGKSTHASLWREHFGERVKMINDDKPLLKVSEEGVTVYGTPWCGKENLCSDDKVRLKSVCFLKRGKSNEISRFDNDLAYVQLLKSCYIPPVPEKAKKVLALAEKLSKTVSFFELICNTDINSAQVAYEAMR